MMMRMMDGDDDGGGGGNSKDDGCANLFFIAVKYTYCYAAVVSDTL